MTATKRHHRSHEPREAPSRPDHGPSPGPPLCAESLARDFALQADVGRCGVGALYEALLAARHPSVRASLEQWRVLLGNARACQADQPSAAIRTLAECVGVRAAGLRAAELLFALHTYYALLVKLLCVHVVASLPRRWSAEAEVCTTPGLRRRMQRLEAAQPLGPWDAGCGSDGELLAWYLRAWTEGVARFVREAVGRLSRYDFARFPDDPAAGGDLLKPLYQGLFPRQVRHELGEYYTPDWLAQCVLDEVGYAGDPRQRLLDPACGSGTFLVAAIDRVRAWYRQHRAACGFDEARLGREILAGVVGFDRHPLAVLTARANYLMAVRDLLGHEQPLQIPVFLHDAILGDWQPARPQDERFDYVVGNPPWIAWDHLPAEYRQATKPLWEHYGLFSLSGTDARHGGGKKDLSMLMTYASADRYLNQGGRLAFVVTQTLFQTKGAGDGFRRFRLGRDGPWLRVLRVNDMVALRPFADAANWTSTILLEKGAPTQYPVPYVKWLPAGASSGGGKRGGGRGGRAARFRRRAYQARPVDPNCPGSPWLLLPDGWTTELGSLIGRSDYCAHLGANSGGANGVYWVRLLGEADGGVLVRNVAHQGRRDAAAVEQVVEPDLIYPLLRWADVARYRVRPSAYLLMVQDPQTRRGIEENTLASRYPRTYGYLERFRQVLQRRAAYRRYQSTSAFYSMYNVGTYTLAPIKVVWRRMDRRINAAVVQQREVRWLGVRPVIPQETCVLIAADSPAEAHYLCALLNSSVVGFLVRSHSVHGGKGFGTPGMLDFVKIPRYDPGDLRHEELAACGRRAHEAADGGGDSAQTDQQIDCLAAELWGLRRGELEAIQGELG